MPDNKWQREIEEILEKEDRSEPLKVMAPRKARPARRPRGSGFRVTPEQMLFGGLILLVLAVILRSWSLPLAIAGATLLVAGYALSLIQSRWSRRGGAGIRTADTPEPYWRGEPVRRRRRSSNVIEFRESWQTRLRRWLRGGKR